MGRITVAVAITLGLALSLAYGQGKRSARSTPRNPCAKAMTQLDLNQCFCEQNNKADAELNRVYQKLLAANAEDKVFVEKLKNAQRAWIAFRDAQLEALYPTVDNPRVTYGSVYPMCHCIAEEELTVERTRQLRRMLEPKEGDVCG